MIRYLLLQSSQKFCKFLILHDGGHRAVLHLDARLVRAGDGIEPSVEDHPHPVHVDRDLADRFPDLADGEHAPDPRVPEADDQFIDELQRRDGNLPEIGQDLTLPLLRRLPDGGHPSPDEHLGRIEG